jgi:hypothetical protein
MSLHGRITGCPASTAIKAVAGAWVRTLRRDADTSRGHSGFRALAIRSESSVGRRGIVHGGQHIRANNHDIPKEGLWFASPSMPSS